MVDIVCVRLAVGTLAVKAKPSAMALAGLLAAPLAFIVARSLSKGVAQALDAGSATGGSSSVFLFALIKAVEYAWLGFLLARLGQRFNAGALAYGGAGSRPASFSAASYSRCCIRSPYPMVARGINEILFPIGCALVICTADALGKRS